MYIDYEKGGKFMAIADKIKELIAEQLNKPVSEVTDEKEVVKDLGADSLDIVEMLMGLEETFNITVPEEEAVNIKTVADVVAVISKNK